MTKTLLLTFALLCATAAAQERPSGSGPQSKAPRASSSGKSAAGLGKQQIAEKISQLTARLQACHQRGQNEELAPLAEQIYELTKQKYAGAKGSQLASLEISQARLYLCQIYTDFAGRFADAEHLFLEQVEDWKGVPKWHAQAQSNLADFYLMIGDYDAAVKPALAALNAKKEGIAKFAPGLLMEKETADAAMILFGAGEYKRAAEIAQTGLNLSDRAYGTNGMPSTQQSLLCAVLLRSNLRLGTTQANETLAERLRTGMRQSIRFTLKDERLPLSHTWARPCLSQATTKTPATSLKAAPQKQFLSCPRAGTCWTAGLGLC